jgi:hypothetical protein
MSVERHEQHGEPGVIGLMRAQIAEAERDRARMAAEIAALTTRLAAVTRHLAAGQEAVTQIREDGRADGYRTGFEEGRAAERDARGMTRARHARPGDTHLRLIQGLAVPPALAAAFRAAGHAVTRPKVLIASAAVAASATAMTLTPQYGQVPARPVTIAVQAADPAPATSPPDAPASPVPSPSGTAPAPADTPAPDPSPPDSAPAADPPPSPSPSDSSGACVSASAGPVRVRVRASVPSLPVPAVPDPLVKAPGAVSGAAGSVTGALGGL